MEHIPLPRNSFHEHLAVKYLAAEHPQLAYDGLDYRSFPARHGLPIPLLLRSDSYDLAEDSWAECLCTIQSWLHHGLIIESLRIAQVNAAVADFIRIQTDQDGNTKTFMDSTDLPRLIHIWRSSLSSKTDQRCLAEFTEIKQLLEEAHDVANNLGSGPFNNDTCFFKPLGYGTRFAMGGVVQLSIAVLHSSLAAALHMYTPRLGKQEMPHGGVFDDSPLLKERMARAGWCPSEYFTLHDQNSSWPEMYYLSSMNRHVLGRDHHSCEYHYRCKMEDLDIATYETKHTKDCEKGPDCSFIIFEHPWSHRITRIVRKGQVPLIIMEEPSGVPWKLEIQVLIAEKRSPALDLEENVMDRVLEKNHVFLSLVRVPERIANDVIPYVCISHVWSDGRGNPHENALPRCQLLRIQERVNALYDSSQWPVPFWIDSICVPLEKRFRKMAIVAMRDIYKKADKVLVLDDVLDEVSTNSISPTEMLMRIQSSTWMRRLWTYQELALAQSLHYQFQDRAVDTRQISALQVQFEASQVNKLSNMGEHPGLLLAGSSFPTSPDLLEGKYLREASTLCPVFQAANNFLYLQQESFTDLSDMISLASLSAAVSWRWTSHLEDETICLAGMLGRDVSDLLELDGEQRMVVFLAGFKELPADILFSAIERSRALCYRWIPKSFIGIGSKALVPCGEAAAVWTAAGLKVVLPGLWLQDKPVVRELGIAGKEAFLVTTGDGAVIECEAPHEMAIAYDKSTPATQLAIILQSSLNKDGSPQSRRAALVVVDDAAGEFLWVTFQQALRIHAVDLADLREDDFEKIIFCSPLPDNQDWRIL